MLNFRGIFPKEINLMYSFLDVPRKDGIKSEELDTYEKFLKWLDSQMKVRTNV